MTPSEDSHTQEDITNTIIIFLWRRCYDFMYDQSVPISVYVHCLENCIALMAPCNIIGWLYDSAPRLKRAPYNSSLKINTPHFFLKFVNS